MKRSNTRWVAGQRAQPGAARLLGAGLLLALLGCQRKAPGPDECLAFAKVWVESRHLAQVPLSAVDPFEELVRECLTAPYDRALVECVLNGKAPERCRMEYARRVEERREPGAL
ncbi:MAG TPA: hypothetical protein VFS67_26705 [Polyangiaceae bacterium]|nr:hypothetical protein [Polyangiaceae bacterium]